MADYVVPDARSLQKMLAVVFGDGLEVTATDACALAGRYGATYVNDDNRIVALCACNAKFVAFAGAALTMLPKDVVDEMLESNSLSEIVISNFHEIMNICSRLMIPEKGAHLRLDKTLDPAAAAGPIAELQPGADAASFSVSIPGYGDGEVSFLVS